PTSPSCFANKKIDTAYVKVNLNEEFYFNTLSSSISLLKVSRIQTGNIEAEPVAGSFQVNYNMVAGWVEFFFYPASTFDPDKDEHSKDGLYWVKTDVVDTFGNSNRLSFFFVYDTTPPQPPLFAMQSFDSTTGILTLSGSTIPDLSEPQSVQGFVNGVLKATTEALPDRSFTIQVELGAGENSVALRAVDRAGNVSAFTAPLQLTYNPEKLLSVVFRSSKLLRRSSATTPVTLIYSVSEPARVSIRIYNLLAEMVYDWEADVIPGMEEEWYWWGDNMFGREVNNGVYIMNIKATSSTRAERVTQLVGVLR
ncbi:hypothetical protein IBX65_09170, partial [Candidatus Aerophobetes bacterium]|nr:hypothetical protein [Candidatus Aerophobetes bacterium]